MDRTRALPWRFLILAVVAAAVFARLGIWQLDRLVERRELNRWREARAELPVLAIADEAARALAPDSVAWRHVRVRGSWDFAHEIVVRGRASRGSPGVHVVTPVRLSDGAAVLVLRGWLPAADGVTTDLTGARPTTLSGRVEVEGVAYPSERPSPIPARRHSYGGEEHLVLGTLDVSRAAEALPYPLASYYVRAETAPGASEAQLPRSPEPVVLSNGPHLAYAIQWFAFALVSLIGGGAYVLARRRSGSIRREAR